VDGRTGPAMTIEPRSDAGERSHLPGNFFIICVDGIFTTLFECLFTNVFDVIAQTQMIPCVYRRCNAD
jgi:hypothetical protein